MSKQNPWHPDLRASFPVVGALQPQRGLAAELSDYLEFKMPFWHGLAKVRKVDGEFILDVLAYVSVNRRRGSFRTFIRMAKQWYDVIEIWEVRSRISPLWFPEVLERYGFKPCYKPDTALPIPDLSGVEGMVWRKNHSPKTK